MCKDNILDQVLGIINSVTGLSIDRVERGTMLININMDSLDRVELTMALEEEFDIEIEFQEEEKWQTIGSICDYLEKHV